MTPYAWSIRIALLALVLAAGCTPTPSVFPPLEGELSDARVLEVLAERTAIPGYSGVVSMDYRDPAMSGALEAVVNWKPAHLRVTAFKGLVVTDLDVFDLLLVPDGFALQYLDETREDVLLRGSLAEFTRTRPRQASFYWVGEALLLPGRTVGAAQVVRLSDEELEVRGRLHSGAEAAFLLDATTLAVRRAHVRTPGGRVVELRYSDYERQGKAFVPRTVDLSDPEFEVTVHVELDEGESTAEFEGFVFDLDDVGSE